jgi:hypothetical protein
MKTLIGILLVVGGIAFGLWAGVWWALIGGIIQIINEVRAPELSAAVVAYGVAKIMLSGVIGWLASIVLLVPGMAILQD